MTAQETIFLKLEGEFYVQQLQQQSWLINYYDYSYSSFMILNIYLICKYIKLNMSLNANFHVYFTCYMLYYMDMAKENWDAEIDHFTR